jgi:P27 family predicted phage terminase small subunit
MVKLLMPAGLLTVVDGDQLALYCVAYARWAEAEKQVAEGGTVVKSPNGYPIQNPYLAIANAAMKQMHAYLAKLGCNPCDRSRVHASPPPTSAEKSRAARFFTEHGLENFKLGKKAQ